MFPVIELCLDELTCNWIIRKKEEKKEQVVYRLIECAIRFSFYIISFRQKH